MNNNQEEQDDKLTELEKKLESALERIEELEEENSEQQDSVFIESAEEPPFRVHWIDPSDLGYSCSEVDTVKKAQEVFAEANAYKNSNGHRVLHGDLLVLMCNYEYGDACYYVGLCVVTNTPNQLSVPNSPDITEDSGNKEFMAWYTCPGENEGTCECDDGVSIPELGSTSEWVVEDDQCVRFTDLTNLEVYQSDSEGTDLKAYTREITLNKCGEIISISQESETVLNIPCCTDDPDDDNEDPGDGGCTAPGWAGLPANVSVERDQTATGGGTQTANFMKTPDCRYLRTSGPFGGFITWDATHSQWSIDGTGATNASLQGQYTNANPGNTTIYTVS